MKDRKHIVCLTMMILCLFGCSKVGEPVDASISFEEQVFSEADKVIIQSAHTGKSATIEAPEDIREIGEFMNRISGIDGISSKGYYEGTYQVKFFKENQEFFCIGFGDNAIFNYGDYGDGYPERYTLDDVTISEVVEFFGQYQELAYSENPTEDTEFFDIRSILISGHPILNDTPFLTLKVADVLEMVSLMWNIPAMHIFFRLY